MQKTYKYPKLFFFKKIILFLLVVFSCSKNDEFTPEITDPEENNNNEEVDPVDPEPNSEGEVLIYNPELVSNSYILVNDAGANRVFLMSKEKATAVFEWKLSGKLGNDAELLDNGDLLAMLEFEEPYFSFGGFGGVIRILNPDSTVKWEYVYASENYLAHHDVEMLPNGNILFLAWEKKTPEETLKIGYKYSRTLYPESLIEINPINNTIVWEWHAWDHLIQDFNEEASTFGVIEKNPQLIDINYQSVENGDIMHANGIAYDPDKDVIYMSVNEYSEVWVIDHSTTTQEARSHEGGKYNKGGDLLFRFGNPEAYKNTTSSRLFYNNHFPNLSSKTNDQDHVMIFMNGNTDQQSIVYELSIPSQSFSQTQESLSEPEIVWRYKNTSLYSPKVSGAIRLENGNTLIAEGDFGFWEVTKNGKIVWKFEGSGFYWRGYSYLKNSVTLSRLNLPNKAL